MSAAAPIASAPRVIRVFVSSTFRDMQAEREELVKRVFPQLRKLCESRGVTWGEVDLRWGITDEQKAEGKVLPICLEEIRRCRPYFIGLLGERYGWVPEEVPPAVTQQEPWLTEQRGHSVTELEILHGVLNNPQMANHAYFYFRDPGYVQSVPLSNRADFEEGATEEETKSFGAEEGKRRAAERQQKLTALKQRIRASGLPLRENYANPQALGELVLEDLTGIINRLFPEGSQPDPLDREAAEHEAFARSRTGVYIGRQEYFAALDAHAGGDGPPLVVLGESGLGKSALLANWALRYRAAHPGELLLMHFIGATPASADWAAMVRRILGEFNRRFDLKIEIPDKPDALRMSFANALYMAATKGRVILILDALNQLEDRDQAPDLVWLPPVLPADVRLIVSTLPGRALEELKKRGWPTLQVEALTEEECKRLIIDYLAQYTHALSRDRVDRIARAPQAANPLYLRALLEELRLWGEHETLQARIEHYLSAATVPDLYRRILERYEQDYERDRSGLVRDAMRLLWAARRGLSEAELMDLLGKNRETGRWWTPAYWMVRLGERRRQRQPLPRAYWSPLHLAAPSLAELMDLLGKGSETGRWWTPAYWMARLGKRGRQRQPQPLSRAYWSPLYLAAEPSLVSRSGLISFFHDYLREAVKQAYLPAAAQQRDAHRTLATYFGLQSQLPRSRQLDELPWQWQEASEWRSLASLLAQPRFVDALWAKNEFEVKSYWTRIEMESRLRMEQVYAATIKEPARDPGHAWLIGILLADTGKPEAALRVLGALVKHFREQGDPWKLQGALGAQANILAARGDLEGAVALHNEAERLCRELGNKDGLSTSLGNQAVILRDRGDLNGAMALLREEERLCRELGNKAGLAMSLGNQANILYDRGDLDGAFALHKEAEHLCRERGNKAGLSTSLGNQAVILQDRGDPNGAMALLREEERLCRELGNKAGLAKTLGNQAKFLYTRGDLDSAMALLREEERLCRELDNKAGLSISLGSQALILEHRGDPDGATALNKEAERISRDLGNKTGLQATLGNQANILYARGDLAGAMALHKQAERLCREMGNKQGLAYTLGSQALILQRRGDLNGAMGLLKEAERICRELGNKDGLQRTLGNQAVILKDHGDLDGAMALYKEAERISRELGDKAVLAPTLGNQANVLSARGDLDGAMALHKEAERLCRELGNKDGLQAVLGNQASVLSDRGDLAGAMALYKEQERLRRQLGDKAGLAKTLGNQGNVLSDRGDLAGAMALYKEAERISRELGNHEGIAISLANQAVLLSSRPGQTPQARRLVDEALAIATRHGYRRLLPKFQRIRDSIPAEAA